jgi:hypothetical protein
MVPFLAKLALKSLGCFRSSPRALASWASCEHSKHSLYQIAVACGGVLRLKVMAKRRAFSKDEELVRQRCLRQDHKGTGL